MAKTRTATTGRRRGRPRRGETEPGALKETILEVAKRLFARRGFDGVSIRDVATEAGVNKALVFYYFQTKATLLDEVLEGYYRDHVAALEGPLHAEGSPSERLHRVIDGYLDFMAGHYAYARIVQQEIARGGNMKRIRQSLGDLLLFTETTLQDLVPKAGPQAARHLFITVSGLVNQYYAFAPALGERWGTDPLSAGDLAERRAHVHWVVDAVLEKLAPRPLGVVSTSSPRAGRGRSRPTGP